MRYALAFLTLATPAAAWDFQPLPVCTLSFDNGKATVRVTYDPAEAEPYAITLDRRDQMWVDAPVFALWFDGPAQAMIRTDRHKLSNNDARLTVTDKGFDNVLGGMALNHVVTAMLGDQIIVLPLIGAAAEVERFLACRANPAL